MISLPLGAIGILAIPMLVGAVQGTFLSLVFWTRRTGDPMANRLLGAAILFITLHLAELFSVFTGWITAAPVLHGTTFWLLFLIGPTFWTYARRVLNPDFRPRGWDLAHAIPAILVLWRTMGWILAPAEMKIPYLEAAARADPLHISATTYVMLVVNVLQYVVYFLLAQRLLRRREVQWREQESDTALLGSVHAMRRVSFGFAVFAGTYLALLAALVFFHGFGVVADSLWLVAVAVFIQWIGWTALRQPETFAHAAAGAAPRAEAGSAMDESPDAEAPVPARSKYRKSALPPDRLREIHGQLVQLMEREKRYLDGTLRLAEIGRALGVSVHNVSQAINVETGGTFFDFVNRYRIEEAKRRLADPGDDDPTILAIALEAGFNNKRSFNQAFRRFEGTTPSQYRDRVAREPHADEPS